MRAGIGERKTIMITANIIHVEFAKQKVSFRERLLA